MNTLSERYKDAIMHGGDGQAGNQIFPEVEEQGIEDNEVLVHPRFSPRLGEISTVDITVEEVKE